MGKNIIVTGSWLINFRLSRLPEKVQTRAIKKATKKAAQKEVMPRIKQSIKADAYDTGAMHDAVKVRATTRTIKANTGIIKEFTKRDGTIGKFQVKKAVGKEFGAKVEITRKDLNKQLAKRGLPELKSDDYYYPAAIELGSDDMEARKPMRIVLPAAYQPTVQVFEQELAAALRDIK